MAIGLSSRAKHLIIFHLRMLDFILKLKKRQFTVLMSKDPGHFQKGRLEIKTSSIIKVVDIIPFHVVGLTPVSYFDHT